MTGTTNLNLTKPTVGADSDVWGNELNSNLDILDAILVGDIYGLTLSASGSTATFGVAAGAASGMILGSAYTKTTGSWAVGSTQGALDTGTIANNTWYHVWLIQRTDTSVVDVLVSTSASSPTMPTNYTRKRRIGAMKTDGSAQWVKFAQIGDEFIWAANTASTVDVSMTPSTTQAAVTLNVPTGIIVKARVRGWVQTGPTNTASFTISSTFESSLVAVNNSNQASVQISSGSAPVGIVQGINIDIHTNTSGQVNVVSSDNNVSNLARLTAYAWIDPRGKF